VETKYGLRGSIIPAGPFATVRETFVHDEFYLDIENGTITIGYDDASKANIARKIVDDYLRWFSFSHNGSYKANLNQSWEHKEDGTRALNVCESLELKMTDRIIITRSAIQGQANIVTSVFDSSNLATYSTLVDKSQRNAALAAALAYFCDEAVDQEHPLYGVYKALEELSNTVGGREKLAALVNAPKSFVTDVMQTTQATRHARTDAQKVLTDEECLCRARRLIRAFADAI
jgi:hypothetical protein